MGTLDSIPSLPKDDTTRAADHTARPAIPRTNSDSARHNVGVHPLSTGTFSDPKQGKNTRTDCEDWPARCVFGI